MKKKIYNFGIIFFTFTLFLMVDTLIAQEEPELEITVEILSIEELLNLEVSTVSKRAQSISQAPAIISVFTSQDIKQLGVRDLTELMSYVPGFAVIENYWKRGIVESRGVKMSLYNDKILMLIDGVPSYDAATLEHYIDAVPITAIDRVEIIRGPGSTLYGTNAFAAVINVITKSGEKQNGIDAHLSYGTFGAREIGLSAGKKDGDFEYYFAGFIRDDDGFNKATVDEQGKTGSINYELDHENFLTKLKYKNFTVTSGYYYEKYGKFGPVPVLAYANKFHKESGEAYNQKFYTNLALEHKFSDKVDAKFTLHYDYMDRQVDVGDFGLVLKAVGAYDGDLVPPDYIGFGGKVFQGEVQFGYLLSEDYSLLTGVSYETRRVEQLSTLLDDRDGNTLIHASTKDIPFNTSDFGGYVQLDGSLTEEIGFVIGVRYTYLGISENGYVTPRGGLVYSLSKQSSVKLLYGEAFRGPGAQEQFYQVPVVIMGSDAAGFSLEPEKIKTFEFAWDQAVSDKAKFRLNGYYLTVADLIYRRPTTDQEKVLTGDARALIYDNGSDQDIYGVEAEVSAYPSDKFNFFANISIKKGTNADTDDDIPFLESILGNAGFNSDLSSKFSLSGNMQFIGEREGQTAAGKTVTIDSYILVNAILNYKISNNFSASIIGKNLFDTDYNFPEPIRRNLEMIPGGPGRSVALRVDFSFK